ncbi:RepA [Eragrostis streak virus]|uniref:Replication-associated protein n=1 Tax=Eragrostis streak virus TaxID=496807 RepID=B0Z3X8_9GEMI|nr:RepA [Eragrostis streak virus]ABZ03982.1 RepA [Eragrostis streak virus]
MSSIASTVPSAPTRRFKHRNVNTFLTYPHCTLEPEVVGLVLWSLLESWTPAYIVVSREAHQDGSWHLHALAQSVKPVYTHDERFFDIEDYHPNIQAAKSANKVRDYVLKNPLKVWERGTFIPRKKTFLGSTSEGNTTKQSKDDIVRDIIEHSTSKQEYLSMIQKALPYEWATKLQYFEYSANRLFPEIQETYTNPHPPTAPQLQDGETIQSWVYTNIYQVSPQAYMLLNPDCLSLEDAAFDLEWMSHTSRIFQEQGSRASTSSAQQEQESPLGPEAWDDIITGRTTSTGPHTTRTQSSTS